MFRLRRSPRFPPPWWPDDVPWPPNVDNTDPSWRRLRRRLMWRVGAVVGIIFFLAISAGTMVFLLITTAFSSSGDRFPTLLALRTPVVLLLAFLVFVLAVLFRTLRRASVPVADLLVAAGKVEAGDYTVRVIERGPREIRALATSFNAMVARLELNEQQRRNLLADVTHELRTPITIIQGNLEGLLDGIYPRDDAHLAMILDEMRIFARLVEDLRTLAQAESGTLSLLLEQTDILAVAYESAASLAAQAHEAGVQITTEAINSIPTLMVDPVRIHAVIDNLILNAMRYTPSGGRIVVRLEHTDSTHSVTVKVSDTGRGIAADILPHIFERFYKSSDSHGSGLGLAIARYIVLAHHGQISAESELGRGTTIQFSLPVNAV